MALSKYFQNLGGMDQVIRDQDEIKKDAFAVWDQGGSILINREDRDYFFIIAREWVREKIKQNKRFKAPRIILDRKKT